MVGTDRQSAQDLHVRRGRHRGVFRGVVPGYRTPADLSLPLRIFLQQSRSLRTLRRPAAAVGGGTPAAGFPDRWHHAAGHEICRDRPGDARLRLQQDLLSQYPGRVLRCAAHRLLTGQIPRGVHDPDDRRWRQFPGGGHHRRGQVGFGATAGTGRAGRSLLLHAADPVRDGLHQPQLRGSLGPDTLDVWPFDVSGLRTHRGWLPARVLDRVLPGVAKNRRSPRSGSVLQQGLHPHRTERSARAVPAPQVRGPHGAAREVPARQLPDFKPGAGVRRFADPSRVHGNPVSPGRENLRPRHSQDRLEGRQCGTRPWCW